VDAGCEVALCVKLADDSHRHRRTIDRYQQKVRVIRPAHGVGFNEAIRPAAIQLAAGAGEEVVDPVVTRMLEVVLVPVSTTRTPARAKSGSSASIRSVL
jgi:hypothetical protein